MLYLYKFGVFQISNTRNLKKVNMEYGKIGEENDKIVPFGHVR